MLKVITLVKRNLAMDVASFQRYWLEAHGPLVSALPGLRRCVQSHSLHQGYSKGELIYDGIEECWFDSEAAWRAALASPEQVQVLASEASFVDPVKKVVMPVEVIVAKAGPIPAGAAKNIEFVNQLPGMPLMAFRDYWRTVHGPLASTINVIRRYEQNHLQLDQYERGQAPAFDGLAITWFDSTAAMKAGAQTEAYALTRADEANFLAPGHLPFIVTREHVLWGD